MGNVNRKFLGIDNGKEYYLADYKIDGKLVQKIEWRIPDIREAIQAEAGHKILAADYSQIEVKLMAFLSGDPSLISALNSKDPNTNKILDIHSQNAAKVFGSRFDFDYQLLEQARKDETHPRHSELSLIRSRVKTVTFGVPYGAGPQRVADMTGLTKDKAEEFIDEFFKAFPILKKWLDDQGRQAIYYRYTTSPRGRKRFYDVPSKEDSHYDEVVSQIRRWAGNQPIQSGNVDMLKPAMRGIYLALRAMRIPANGARLLLVVHDEIVMTAEEALVPVVQQIMEDEMMKSYKAIIGDSIVNKIDVVVDSIYRK
jgi:DNA polymerase-1